MPIYEYQCSECRERHEIIQTISEPPLTHCPKCGGSMKKLVSSPAIQFKGSGFYKTDYASSSARPTGENGSSSDSPATGAKPESGAKAEAGGSTGATKPASES